MLPNYVESEEILQSYIKAGKIARAALKFGEKLIVEGAVIKEVLDKIEAFIHDQGAAPAFPAQISLNTVAAHSCAAEDDATTFKDGDLVKLDVGAQVNGYVGDNALSICIGDHGELKKLSEAAKAARDAAIKIIKPGITPNEIGTVIEKEITERGFHPIRNLSGHGLGQYIIHTAPSIPNYPNGDETPIEKDHVFAIEPFATTGKGMIQSTGTPTIFSLQRVRPVRSPLARPVVEQIKSYKGLPFTLRWLTKQHGPAKTKLALHALKQAGVLNEYPPLHEVADGLVAQSEHTVLVTEDGVRILTTD